MKPSTRGFFRAARRSGESLWDTIHGYVYVRWPYGYIGSAIGERKWLLPLRALFAPFLFRALQPDRWANAYHGKVMPTDAVTHLVQVQEAIELTVPEQVIPFASARDLILSEPDHLVALDCPCRVARQHPCTPLDVCLIVGEPFASFVLEHHPTKSRAITSSEAVGILRAEAERGHVHHAFFKEAMLGRFYAICNCCSCCCGAISEHRAGTPMLISSGYVAEVAEERCVRCGACEGVCSFGAVAVAARAVVDTAKCMGCGACVTACPADALSLKRDESKPGPLEIPAPFHERIPVLADTAPD